MALRSLSGCNQEGSLYQRGRSAKHISFQILLIIFTSKNYIFIFYTQNMKVQSNDQDLQLLLKNFNIQHPKLKCGAGNQVKSICINTQCEGNALRCHQKNCNKCFKAHRFCQNVFIQSFTDLLESRLESQRQFLIKIIQIENQLINDIQKRKKTVMENFSMYDLSPQYQKVIDSIYFKKVQNLELNPKVADQLFNILKKNAKQMVQSDERLIKRFKTEVDRILKSLIDSKTNVIKDFINQSKDISESSRIIKKQNVDYLQFLKLSFPGVRRFQRLFRASDHGFSAAKFHQICGQVSHTFSLIQTEFGKIIGGYTPFKWHQQPKNNYIKDNSKLSFLLSFNLKEKMSLTISQCAIYNHENYGPTFGGGHDLNITDKCNQSNNSYANFPFSYNCNGKYANSQQSWTALIGATSGSKFKVIEYEIYKVIWQ